MRLLYADNAMHFDEKSFEVIENMVEEFVVSDNKTSVHYVGSHNDLPLEGLKALPSIAGSRSITKIDLSHCNMDTVHSLFLVQLLETQFANLRALIMDNCHLRDRVRLPRLPSLTILSMNKNNLKSSTALRQQLSTQCPKLEALMLMGNPLCPHPMFNLEDDETTLNARYRRFRLSIISHSPNLKFLDDRHVTAEERRAVHHMTSGVVVHSTMEQHGRHLPVVSYPTMETKLMPKSDADFNSGHSSKVRYHYLGKHSEGNRFITNQDL